MYARFAFLCDFAQETGNGKIGAFGIGIDHFTIENLANPAAPFYLVVSLEGTRAEAGLKRVEIHLMDLDGRPVLPPMQGQVKIEAPPQGLRVGANVVLCYNNVRFSEYGTYAISILVDGNEVKSIPLVVSQP